MTKYLTKLNSILDRIFIQTLRHEFQQNLTDTRREYSSISKLMLFGVPVIFGFSLFITEASPFDWILYFNLGYTFLLSIYIHFKPISIPLWLKIIHLPLFIFMLILTEYILYEKYLAYPNFMLPLIFLVSFYFHNLKFSITLMTLAFGLLAYIFYLRDIEDALILWNLYFGSTVLTGLAVHRIFSRILEASQTDALTGLKNRGCAEKNLLVQIHLSNRHSTPLSLIYIDVDDFKNINDNLGHLKGDEILRDVANSISFAGRESDIFSRWGGDEFVIILPLTGLLDAKNCIERLNDNLSTIKISCGVVELEKNENMDKFLTRADQAMYEVKFKKKSKLSK